MPRCLERTCISGLKFHNHELWDITNAQIEHNFVTMLVNYWCLALNSPNRDRFSYRVRVLCLSECPDTYERFPLFVSSRDDRVAKPLRSTPTPNSNQFDRKFSLILFSRVYSWEALVQVFSLRSTCSVTLRGISGPSFFIFAIFFGQI